MATPVSKTNPLGFNRMEMANIRRSYEANKLNFNKLNRIYEKIAKFQPEVDNLNATIAAWDAPVKALSLQKLGVELTSEEVMLSVSDPEKFFQIHPELIPQEQTGTAEATPEATEEGPSL